MDEKIDNSSEIVLDKTKVASPSAEDRDTLKELNDLRKDIDDHFAQLDRLLEVAKNKEE